MRLREIAEPGALAKGTSYAAELRMRLDTSQLPRPFQVSAVGSRDWNSRLRLVPLDGDAMSAGPATRAPGARRAPWCATC